jgi:hypothetical protein
MQTMAIPPLHRPAATVIAPDPRRRAAAAALRFPAVPRVRPGSCKNPDALRIIEVMLKLFSVEAGLLEAPNLTRILFSIVTVAETKDEALLFAQRHYPEAIAEGTERRVVEIKHLIIDWRAGEAVIEEKHTRRFHC